MKPSNDREAVTLILEGLAANGRVPTGVNNGDDGLISVDSVDEAVQYVMEVDEATVYVSHPDGSESFIFFVLGNDPEEVVCDHGVSLSEFIDPIVEPWWDF